MMSNQCDSQPLGVNFVAPFSLGGRTHSTLLSFMVLLKAEFATASQCSRVPGSLRATLALYKKTPRLTPEQHSFWKSIRSQLLAAAVLAQIKSHPELLIKSLFGGGGTGMQFPGVSPNVPDAKYFANSLEQTWKALGDRLGRRRPPPPPPPTNTSATATPSKQVPIPNTGAATPSTDASVEK